MNQIKFQIEGVVPLLLHNGRTKNPLDHYAKALKEIASKRNKTDSDYERMAFIEMQAGLYVDSDNNTIHIPDNIIEQCITGGAKQERLGKKFAAGMFVDEPMVLKDFSGRVYTREQVLEDRRYWFTTDVKIQRNSVMRTRPRFDEWKGEFVVTYNPDVLNEAQVVRAAKKAGSLVGLCDWRPKFGRFNVIKAQRA